jgi:hypothetical protein
MHKYLAVAMISIPLFAGCTWVRLTPAGEEVRVVSAAETVGCKKIGQTTVSLLAKVAGIERNAKKVATELQTLGRNSGAEMGGDTIVAVSGITDGEQSFDVYRCTVR